MLFTVERTEIDLRLETTCLNKYYLVFQFLRVHMLRIHSPIILTIFHCSNILSPRVVQSIVISYSHIFQNHRKLYVICYLSSGGDKWVSIKLLRVIAQNFTGKRSLLILLEVFLLINHIIWSFMVPSHLLGLRGQRSNGCEFLCQERCHERKTIVLLDSTESVRHLLCARPSALCNFAFLC